MRCDYEEKRKKEKSGEGSEEKRRGMIRRDEIRGNNRGVERMRWEEMNELLTYCTRTIRIDGMWPDARGVGVWVYGCSGSVAAAAAVLVVVVVSKKVKKTRQMKTCMRKKTRRGRCR